MSCVLQITDLFFFLLFFFFTLVQALVKTFEIRALLIEDIKHILCCVF